MRRARKDEAAGRRLVRPSVPSCACHPAATPRLRSSAFRLDTRCHCAPRLRAVRRESPRSLSVSCSGQAARRTNRRCPRATLPIATSTVRPRGGVRPERSPCSGRSAGPRVFGASPPDQCRFWIPRTWRRSVSCRRSTCSANQRAAGLRSASSVTMSDHRTSERERPILTDIGALSDRLRQLRASPRLDTTQVRALEAQARLKWEELRAMRAGPANGELPRPDSRGHYR